MRENYIGRCCLQIAYVAEVEIGLQPAMSCIEPVLLNGRRASIGKYELGFGGFCAKGFKTLGLSGPANVFISFAKKCNPLGKSELRISSRIVLHA